MNYDDEEIVNEENKEVEQKKEVTLCRHCGKVITQDNVSELADDICEDCEDNYFECEICGDIEEVNNEYYTHDDKHICRKCLDNDYTYCSCCEEYYPNDEVRYIEDKEEYVCDSCYHDNNYFQCDSCGNYYSEDVLRTDDDGCCYCEDCYEEISPILSYPTKIEDIAGVKLFQTTDEDKKDLKLFYGIELEVVADYNFKQSVNHTKELLGEENIICKRDGSLDSGGYEIVTAPMSYNRHHEFWRNFFEVERNGKHYAKDLSSFNTNCCGIHIHVSRKALQLSDICKIVFFINEASNNTFVNFIASRSENEYAQIKRKTLSELQSIQKFGKLDGYNDRYEAVNLNNTDTIEIRIFKGTVEQISFFKNLEFVDCLIKFVRNKKFLQLSYDEFLKFLAKYKDRYKNLYEWIMNKDNHYSEILKGAK
ncbi:MAG: hypothetical protein MJ244_05120 [Clostridia bacterium]|nr:hypothetical protein [Clostridia bacterium]